MRLSILLSVYFQLSPIFGQFSALPLEDLLVQAVPLEASLLHIYSTLICP